MLHSNRKTASTMPSSFLAFLLVCWAGITLAEEPETVVLPSTYRDDLYHCADPTYTGNLIPCDPTTFRWKLNALKAKSQPDKSPLCQEVVDVLVRAREQETFATAGRVQAQTQKDVQVWESIMEASVVDELEPCILWSMSFGQLAPWATSIGKFEHQQHVDINDNSDPLASYLEIAFDPFVIGLVWEEELNKPLSVDRTELHDLTGRHILDSLRAELGAEIIEHLDLTVTAGLPDYKAKVLPLTLSGTVVFDDPRRSLGPSSLERVILKSAFADDNARDLYLFRLRIANDPTLQEVRTVMAGRDALTQFILRPNLNEAPPRENESQQFIDTSEMNLSKEDEGLVSILLVAILSAVAASILAVVCFAYFLVFRSRTSNHAAKTLDENSHDKDIPTQIGRNPYKDEATKKPKKVYRDKVSSGYEDGVPAVQTAPTETVEDDEYDIEYVAGNQDDGVSEYDMDTLPPPSSLPDDSDDDNSIVMSVMDGFDDENLNDEEAVKHQSDDSDMSDTNTYNYIPDDTSLSMMNKETTLEKTQKKGILWSVMNHQPRNDPNDSDRGRNSNTFDGSDISTELSYNESKGRTSILGPSDNEDTQSHDSNSLLYGTDEDTAITPLSSFSGYRLTEIPLEYNSANEKEQEPPQDHQQQQQMQPQPQSMVQPSATGQESVDKKMKFEELWKDGNEFDEVASVLEYLDSAQSARRSAQSDAPSPMTNLKIVDVATPMTPDRPPRRGSESASVNSSSQPVSESLVDRVPQTTDDEDNRMNLPLPSTLQDACSSVSSGVSGKGSQKQSYAVGESARRNKSNKWIRSSTSSVGSSGNSVCSTDSAKLRSLLGQSDTNDAAIVFGNKQPTQPRTDDENSLGSNSASEAEMSMSSCTSTKLKSLLTRADSQDATSDDDDNDRPEDFLFNNTVPAKEIPGTRRRLQEEKKESGEDDDEEVEERTSYLPTSITPRTSSQQLPTAGFDTPDDATTFSALSEAPSVDETISSGMGWF